MSWNVVLVVGLALMVLGLAIVAWCVVSVAKEYGSSIARRSVTLYERMYALSDPDDVLWLAQMPHGVAEAYIAVTRAVHKHADKEASRGNQAAAS